MPISKLLKEDRLVWHYTKSGIYTVKSGYGLAHELTKEVVWGPTTTALKTHAWKIKAPPKIKHLL